MSIPLDRLYHYIENVAQEIYNDRIIIYRFYPHGSKNIDDLNNLYDLDTWCDKTIYPGLWCNDQEPLDHKFYSKNIKIRSNSEFVELLNTSDKTISIKDWKILDLTSTAIIGDFNFIFSNHIL